MAKPVVYRWIAADPSAVCLTQFGIDVDEFFNLNGTLSTGGNPNITGLSSQPPAIAYFDKISRNISISSVDNLHENLTITGTLCGREVSETILGPNIGIVYTDQVYDTVTSISSDGPVMEVSVGTGQIGSTQWFPGNYCATVQATSVQVAVSGTITYSFVGTLDDVNVVPDDDIASFPLINEMHDATEDLFSSTTIPFRYVRIVITASTGDASLTATIMQQG